MAAARLSGIRNPLIRRFPGPLDNWHRIYFVKKSKKNLFGFKGSEFLGSAGAAGWAGNRKKIVKNHKNLGFLWFFYENGAPDTQNH